MELFENVSKICRNTTGQLMVSVTSQRRSVKRMITPSSSESRASRILKMVTQSPEKPSASMAGEERPADKMETLEPAFIVPTVFAFSRKLPDSNATPAKSQLKWNATNADTIIHDHERYRNGFLQRNSRSVLTKHVRFSDPLISEVRVFIKDSDERTSVLRREAFSLDWPYTDVRDI